jgi:hypothetical protein
VEIAVVCPSNDVVALLLKRLALPEVMGLGVLPKGLVGRGAAALKPVVPALSSPGDFGAAFAKRLIPGDGVGAEPKSTLLAGFVFDVTLDAEPKLLNKPPLVGCVAAVIGVEPNSTVPAGFGFAAPVDGELNNPSLFDLVSAGV